MNEKIIVNQPILSFQNLPDCPIHNVEIAHFIVAGQTNTQIKKAIHK